MCREFAVHYHEERPQQAAHNEVIQKPTTPKAKSTAANAEIIRLSELRDKERRRGLLKIYSRKAA